MTKLKILIAFAAVALVGCQKIDLTEETVGEGSATLRVRVNDFEYLPFETRAEGSATKPPRTDSWTRAAATPAEVSKRISFALFDMNGEKAMTTKSQASDETNYGLLNVNLNPGRYILVTVAHNGEGNCTISSPTEIKFKDNKVTDTFTSCDTLTVMQGEQTARITLRRRVAMMRLLLDEKLPTEVTQLKFYYTGGSSTLDASTGYGSVNSRQTEILKVPASAYTTTGTTYEVYTFPHEERDTLKLTISALNAAGVVVAEKEIAKVPVKVCQITQFHGTLTGGGDTQGLQLELTIDDTDWERKDYKF